MMQRNKITPYPRCSARKCMLHRVMDEKKSAKTDLNLFLNIHDHSTILSIIVQYFALVNKSA